MIHLVGPGAAGKSTVGAALASHLQSSFLDLDTAFKERAGDISRYIDRHGYEAYARENVETYRFFAAAAAHRRVVALSSGFMTYPERIHPAYHALRTEIASAPSTFVLLPSLDPEVCVAETVRRQMTRPFRRSRDREKAVIRERYSIYIALPAAKVETMRPVDEVVDAIASGLPPDHATQRTKCSPPRPRRSTTLPTLSASTKSGSDCGCSRAPRRSPARPGTSSQSLWRESWVESNGDADVVAVLWLAVMMAMAFMLPAMDRATRTLMLFWSTGSGR